VCRGRTTSRVAGKGQFNSKARTIGINWMYVEADFSAQKAVNTQRALRVKPVYACQRVERNIVTLQEL